MNEEIYNIENWKNIPLEFFSELEKKFDERKTLHTHDLRHFEIDHVKLYCLLKSKVSDMPNGFFTMLMKDKPIGNIFWWDFIIESELGYVHFFRSQSKIEVSTNINPEIFDAIKFVKFNLKKYSESVNETKKALETHSLLINHYKSYAECTDYLWKEIRTLKISSKSVEEKLEENPDQIESILEEFINNNIKFHSCGKSLLLNAAFMVESYLTLLIRVTAKVDLKDYPDILKKHLNSNFAEKLKNLKYFSFIIKSDVDLNAIPITNTLKLIEMRNKYVHADLSSKLNEIGTVYFDEYYPVFPSYNYSPIVENITRVYQVPKYESIKFA